MSNHLTWVIFDSVTNSIFSSQVLEPLRKKLLRGDADSATIISFERSIERAQSHLATLTLPPATTVKLFHRLPFFGVASLWQPTRRLIRYLISHPTNLIIARGPLAGRITISTLAHLLPRPKVTVQARGLAAAEQRFICSQTGCYGPKHWIHSITNKLLEQIEHETYSTAHNITIESISPALSTYLINTFHANPKKLTIASDDLPEVISEQLHSTLRSQIRKLLKIKPSTHIYCYSGSTHPWQCISDTITYFISQLTINPDSYLLILTTSPSCIKPLLCTLPPSTYSLLSIHPSKLTDYLCAADTGIIIRHPHIINHVSRPTKAIEYRAARLKIHHNNTVAYLIDQPNQNNQYAANSLTTTHQISKRKF